MALGASPSLYPYSPGLDPAAAKRYTDAAQAYLHPPGAATPTAAPAASSPAAAAASPFDYQKYLANEPVLGSILGGINASGLANKEQLISRIRGYIGRYGAAPSISGLTGEAAGLVGAAVDPTTAALAQQNTQAGVSTIAGLRRLYDTSQQQSTADLAARGLLRSGAYGQHSAENLQAFTGAQYQADQQLLDALQSLYESYLSQQDSLRGQSVNATNDALGRLIQQLLAGITPGTVSPAPATPDPSAATQGVFAPLNNLTQSDWQRISELPVNRGRVPAGAAVAA